MVDRERVRREEYMTDNSLCRACGKDKRIMTMYSVIGGVLVFRSEDIVKKYPDMEKFFVCYTCEKKKDIIKIIVEASI